MQRWLLSFACLVGLAASAFAQGANQPPDQHYQIGDLRLESGEVIKDFQPEVYNPGHRRARLFYQYNNIKPRRLPITGGFICDWIPVDDFTWTDAGITFLATEDHRGCRLRLIYDSCRVDASFVKALRLHIDETWQDLLCRVALR